MERPIGVGFIAVLPVIEPRSLYSRTIILCDAVGWDLNFGDPTLVICWNPKSNSCVRVSEKYVSYIQMSVGIVISLWTSFSKAVLEEDRRSNCWGYEFHEKECLTIKVCSDECSWYTIWDQESGVSKGVWHLISVLRGWSATVIFDEATEE